MYDMTIGGKMKTFMDIMFALVVSAGIVFVGSLVYSAIRRRK